MSYTPQPNTFTLFVNDKGDNPKRPDYRGDAVLPDGTKMKLSCWLKESANGNLCITDRNGNDVYFEISRGFWCKREHDSQGNQIYFENSIGHIVVNRPPEIIEHNGRKYQLIP